MRAMSLDPHRIGFLIPILATAFRMVRTIGVTVVLLLGLISSVVGSFRAGAGLRFWCAPGGLVVMAVISLFLMPGAAVGARPIP